MHDDLIERRLRATLRDEADRQPFTITAAALERRAALRSRTLGSRRLGLLVAAAVGIGLVGVGGALAGLLNEPIQSPTPTSPIVLATDRAPSILPDLDEMLASAPVGSVVLAQAHGPGDGRTVPGAVDPGAMTVNLGTFRGSSTFDAKIACLGPETMRFSVTRFIDQGSPTYPVTCDGSVVDWTVTDAEDRTMFLDADQLASWRIVIRRLDGAAPPPITEPPLLDPGTEKEDLVRLEDSMVDAGAPALAPSGLLLQEVGAVPARERYTFVLWCLGGRAIRYIHGDEIDGTFAASTITQVPCDGSLSHGILNFPEPNGSRVYVAADPDSRWSILVESEQPPVSLAPDQPGWEFSAGFGPHLELETSTQSFTGPGVDGGGQVLIVIACAGSGTIEVTVDVGVNFGERHEPFVANCTPEGATTGQSFEVDASYVDVTYTSPAGSWTAVSILIPES